MTETNSKLTRITIDEVISQREAGITYFHNLHITGMTDGIVLKPGTFLSSCEFEKGNFNRSILNGVHFWLCDLGGASFDRATLNDVRFSHCRMSDTKFRDANLEGARFYHSHCYDANFSYANLQYAGFGHSSLQYANLVGANLNSTMGLYSVFVNDMSSRNDILLAGINFEQKKPSLIFSTGCFYGTGAMLERRLEATKKEQEAKAYRRAISFIRMCFSDDIKSGKYDYMLLENRS